MFNPLIVEGAYNAVVLAVLVQVVATVLGLIVALMRRSKNPVVSQAAWLYVWFFRGVPVIIQLFFWFSAMPVIFETFSISIPLTNVIFWQARSIDVITPFMAALLGLGLYGAAYMAEILRSGIEAVAPGQLEAARTLGLNYQRTMRYVVVPQAVRVIVPTTASEFIRTLKNTSLAAVVTYNEVLHAAQDIYNTNLRIAELLFVASAWYLLMVTVTSAGQSYLEKRFRQ
jgi:polar amino acid transport system permease protein